jgi:hypothetical protein
MELLILGLSKSRTEKCNMDMQRGNQHEHVEWTSSIKTWTCTMDMQHGPTPWKYSMFRTCSMGMDVQHGCGFATET